MDHSQRIAAKLALEVLAADGFLLAGGQALIEHGITERLLDDIDLFALHRRHTPATFAASVQKMTTALEAGGYAVEITRQYEEFASVTVGHDEEAVVIDLGLDWWENSPAIIDIGPVLSLKDSVASKLLAVYSRGYARDYLDAYSIITSQRFTHRQLITLCERRDPTLDLAMFAAATQTRQPTNTETFIVCPILRNQLAAEPDALGRPTRPCPQGRQHCLSTRPSRSGPRHLQQRQRPGEAHTQLDCFSGSRVTLTLVCRPSDCQGA